MNGKENPLELVVMCAVMIVLSILGIAGGFTKDLFGNLDGILLLAICLMMLVVSALLLFGVARDEGWIGKKNHKDGPAGASPATK
jgi:hypothetical protein